MNNVKQVNQIKYMNACQERFTMLPSEGGPNTVMGAWFHQYESHSKKYAT